MKQKILCIAISLILIMGGCASNIEETPAPEAPSPQAATEENTATNTLKASKKPDVLAEISEKTEAFDDTSEETEASQDIIEKTEAFQDTIEETEASQDISAETEAFDDTSQETEASQDISAETEAFEDISEGLQALGEIREKMKALGEIRVEKNLYDVTLTLPKAILGELTQSELDAMCIEEGYLSATLHADGSATFILTKEQHEEALSYYRQTANQELSEMTGSDTCPNITDIQINDNFTEFTVTTTSTELSLEESLLNIMFYLYGSVYSILEGSSDYHASVIFVNADSGEIIKTVNSPGLQKLLSQIIF